MKDAKRKHGFNRTHTFEGIWEETEGVGRSYLQGDRGLQQEEGRDEAVSRDVYNPWNCRPRIPESVAAQSQTEANQRRTLIKRD